MCRPYQHTLYFPLLRSYQYYLSILMNVFVHAKVIIRYLRYEGLRVFTGIPFFPPLDGLCRRQPRPRSLSVHMPHRPQRIVVYRRQPPCVSHYASLRCILHRRSPTTL